MESRSWYDMERSSCTIMEIYKKVLDDGAAFREEAKQSRGSTKERYASLADAMYRVAIVLENTEEVNPTKKATPPEVATY